jgi:hypothetical protein
MVDRLETLTMQYWATVQRIRRLRVPAADKAIGLTDLDVIYGREVRRFRRPANATAPRFAP